MNQNKIDAERGEKPEETGRTGRKRTGRKEADWLGETRQGLEDSCDGGSQLLASDLGFKTLLLG